MQKVNVFGSSSPLKIGIYFLMAIIGWLSFNQFASAQSTEKKIIFSSQYTNLQKCNSGMTNAEEKRLEKSAMERSEEHTSELQSL